MLWYVNNNIMVFSGSKKEISLLYVPKETNVFCDVDYLDIIIIIIIFLNETL